MSQVYVHWRTVKATVLRDGQPQSIPADEVVPGDVVLLSAGSLIPADGVLLMLVAFRLRGRGRATLSA